ncbi:hypothetical protein MRX96_018276 [Rhipicephalus microplus]
MEPPMLNKESKESTVIARATVHARGELTPPGSSTVATRPHPDWLFLALSTRTAALGKQRGGFVRPACFGRRLACIRLWIACVSRGACVLSRRLPPRRFLHTTGSHRAFVVRRHRKRPLSSYLCDRHVCEISVLRRLGSEEASLSTDAVSRVAGGFL